ncbi:melanocyte-stimulating hormone receptor-like [Mercenaria mercenaria]|uniref:melanocyte-stimulating hormone receptor-like n=1 Tax=Mercenaria mercenaria TaxID=6596 RepID=UPI00234EEA99|nr:melanocyte-stimulating hormone receptor-like [Mercenaria mercenaria]
MCEINHFDTASAAVRENVTDLYNSTCGNSTRGGSGRGGRSYGYQKFSCGYCDTKCVYSGVQTVFIIGIIANFFVIARVIRDKRLRDSTFVAIAALAVADLLFLTLNLSTAFERVILSVTCSSPKVISKPYYILKSIFWFSANTHVALLAILRYITLAYPLRANAFLSPKKVIFSSLLVWVLGFVITGTLTGLITVRLILPGRSQEFLIFLWISVYLLPLIVTCVLHILKICLVKRAVTETATESTRKSIQRMSKIVIVVIIMAAVLPLPRLINKCMKLAGRDVFPSSDFKTHFGEIADILFLANNSINPFIYGFLSDKFRRSLKQMFSCIPGVNDDSVATTDTPLSVRKQNYVLEPMPRKYSYADSLDSVERV